MGATSNDILLVMKHSIEWNFFLIFFEKNRPHINCERYRSLVKCIYKNYSWELIWFDRLHWLIDLSTFLYEMPLTTTQLLKLKMNSIDINRNVGFFFSCKSNRDILESQKPCRTNSISMLLISLNWLCWYHLLQYLLELYAFFRI